MLWTGLIIAALLLNPANVGAQQSQSQTETATVAPITVEAVRPDTDPRTAARTRDGDEVICRNRPATGSRFNHRRCQTRAQAAVAQTEARHFMNDLMGPGPSTDAALGGGPR